MTGPQRLLDRVDALPMLEHLEKQPVDYPRDDAAEDGTWHLDTWRTPLESEQPGPPHPDGSWHAARRIVERYEFSDPRLVRAVYRENSPLLGRTMLLEARFLLLRFYLGVRVTDVIDEAPPSATRGAGRRVWGWAYETLAGHLERGRLSYEVIKDQDTGEVEFLLTAHSQRSPSLGPVLRLGWWLFGRRTQLRFYARCGQRLARAVEARATNPSGTPAPNPQHGLVLAPSDARRRMLDRFGIRRPQPG